MLDGSSQECECMLIVTVSGSVFQQVWVLTADCLTEALHRFLLLCS